MFSLLQNGIDPKCTCVYLLGIKYVVIHLKCYEYRRYDIERISALYVVVQSLFAYLVRVYRCFNVSD